MIRVINTYRALLSDQHDYYCDKDEKPQDEDNPKELLGIVTEETAVHSSFPFLSLIKYWTIHFKVIFKFLLSLLFYLVSLPSVDRGLGY